MKNMKKFLAGSLSAAMVMASAFSVSAAEVPADIPSSFKVEYGIHLDADEGYMDEAVTVLTDGKLASGSLTVDMNMDGEAIKLDMPDYVVGTEDALYLNIDSVLNAASAGTDIGEVKEALGQLGITGQYLELIPIDLTKIVYDGKIEIPKVEISEEFFTDLANTFSAFIEMEPTEEGMCFIVNSDTIANGAASLDSFKNEHLGFVKDFLSSCQEATGGSIDVKPAIRPYIDAFARGVAKANDDVTLEQASQMIDAVVDMFVNSFLSEVAGAVNSVSIDDIWDSISLETLIKSALGEGTFELKVIIGEKDGSFSLTVNGDTITGTIETSGQTTVITLFDADSNKVGTVEMTSSDTHSEAVVKDGNDEVVVSCVMDMVVNGNDVSLTYDYTMAQDNAHMTMYFNMTEWENDGSLKAPESSCSVLDIIENVVGLLMAQE